MNNISIDKTVNSIIELYNKKGNMDYGESITQLEHGLQCADIGVERGYDDELVVAGLLHDIGHLIETPHKMGDLGTLNHEEIGANYMKELGFSDRVVELIRNHVNTKRYLIAKDEEYRNNLSKASIGTLKYQNGIMSDDESDEYQKLELFQDHLKLRNLDDTAKIIGMTTNSLEHYRPVIMKVLNENLIEL